MPIYEYVCSACSHPFEKRLSFAESGDVQPCPECGSQRTKKAISLFARQGSAAGAMNAASGAACGPVG